MRTNKYTIPNRMVFEVMMDYTFSQFLEVYRKGGQELIRFFRRFEHKKNMNGGK